MRSAARRSQACCFTAADSQRLPVIAERAHRRSVAGVLIKDKVNVHFTGLSESAIVLEITCWFESSDSSQYAGTRHALLLAVLEVVEFFSAFAPPKK